jgi:hypothetical protein
MLSLSVATIASAANQTLSAAITGTYSADGNTVNSSTSAIFDGTPHIYRVDISTLLGGSPSATESFGAAAFDVSLGAHLSRLNNINNANVRTNYLKNDPAMTNIIDSVTTNAITNYFSGGDNTDLGTSATDLIGIAVDVDGNNLGKTADANTFAPVTDPRQAIGKGSAFKLGSVFVLFDGQANTTLNFANVAYSIANTAGTPIFGNSVASQIASVAFNAVPEPASIALMGIGVLGLVGSKLRRRHA